MKLQFERTPTAIRAALVELDGSGRIAEVTRASDARRVFALDIEPIVFKPLDALFSYASVVRVEIEQRGDGWRVEVAYWSRASGALAQYETDAPYLIVALTRALADIDV